MQKMHNFEDEAKRSKEIRKKYAWRLFCFQKFFLFEICLKTCSIFLNKHLLEILKLAQKVWLTYLQFTCMYMYSYNAVKH